MARNFEIKTLENFKGMITVMENYFKQREAAGLPFQALNIVSKKYRKPKTSAQHRTYWHCIGELKKAFIKNGHDTNEEEIHEFVKKNSGFTRSLMGTMVTLSVSDSSDDATSNELNRLIDFIQRFAAEEFGHNIEVG